MGVHGRSPCPTQVPVHQSLAFAPRAPSTLPGQLPWELGLTEERAAVPQGLNPCLPALEQAGLWAPLYNPNCTSPSLEAGSCTEVVTDPQIVLGSFWVLPKLVFVSGEPFEGPPGGISSTGPCPFHPAPGSLSSALLGCRKLCLSLHSTISIRDAHEGSRDIQSNISQIKKIESSSSGCGI